MEQPGDDGLPPNKELAPTIEMLGPSARAADSLGPMISVIAASASVSLQAWASPPTRNNDQQCEPMCTVQGRRGIDSHRADLRHVEHREHPALTPKGRAGAGKTAGPPSGHFWPV